jgi:hypothetical protein
LLICLLEMNCVSLGRCSPLGVRWLWYLHQLPTEVSIVRQCASHRDRSRYIWDRQRLQRRWFFFYCSQNERGGGEWDEKSGGKKGGGGVGEVRSIQTQFTFVFERNKINRSHPCLHPCPSNHMSHNARLVFQIIFLITVGKTSAVSTFGVLGWQWPFHTQVVTETPVWP